MSIRFSILVPTFNREALLRETIDSVLAQSFQDFELIVIDDGSTDHTWDMLESYGSRVRALRQVNQGPEVARNLGASQASGDYLVLLDSDDILLPTALHTYEQVIRACGAPALMTGVLSYFVHGKSRPADTSGSDVIKFRKYADYLSKDVSVGLSSSNILIRKSIFDLAGGLRKSTQRTYQVDTYATVLRFGTSSPCAIIEHPATVGYRIHATNTVRDVSAMIEAMVALIKGEHQGQYPGGRARRFDRYACLGGMSLDWVRKALKAGCPGPAARLLRHCIPFAAATLLKKSRSKFRRPAPVIRISPIQTDTGATSETGRTPHPNAPLA